MSGRSTNYKCRGCVVMKRSMNGTERPTGVITGGQVRCGQLLDFGCSVSGRTTIFGTGSPSRDVRHRCGYRRSCPERGQEGRRFFRSKSFLGVPVRPDPSRGGFGQT